MKGLGSAAGGSSHYASKSGSASKGIGAVPVVEPQIKREPGEVVDLTVDAPVPNSSGSNKPKPRQSTPKITITVDLTKSDSEDDDDE